MFSSFSSLCAKRCRLQAHGYVFSAAQGRGSRELCRLQEKARVVTTVSHLLPGMIPKLLALAGQLSTKEEVTLRQILHQMKKLLLLSTVLQYVVFSTEDLLSNVREYVAG